MSEGTAKTETNLEIKNDESDGISGRLKEAKEYENQKNEKTCLCCPRVISGKLFGCIDYYINPVVMGVSILVIWGFVIFTVLGYEIAGNVFGNARLSVVKYFTWLYVSALSIFVVFAFYLIFSKYGDIKLGPKNEPPRYSLPVWFSMLFSAGIGVGLYFFGVAEPVFYISELQSGGSRWYDNQINKQGMDSINLAWFHWGFSASATYVIAGLPLAYHHHVQSEPMRESICFIELIGKKYVNAAIGNIIDICSVVGTMFGVSTSLGLGALQINSGLKFVFNIKENFENQMFIIWFITLMATISVLSGIDKGIKILSQAFIIISGIGLLYIFWAGDSIFYLNLLIQGIGYHLQWILELQFSTQAFEQSGFYDKNDAQQLSSVSEQQGWMSGWTIFYWAWWIAWAPFVGIFLANISRGRTVRMFVIGNMVVPTLITCLWFTIVGGFGLYNEMGAIQNDMNCLTDINGNSYSDFGMFNDYKIIKLSCYKTPEMFFAALTTLPFKQVTSMIIIISIILGFVTSSDSASMVIDMLTASGNEFPPKIQRLFWAISEGMVATALLAAVKDGSALSALQAASLVGALPLTIILLFELMATMRSFKKHFGEIDESKLIYWKNELFGVCNQCKNDCLLSLLCPLIQTKSVNIYYIKTNNDDYINKIINIILIWITWIGIFICIFISLGFYGIRKQFSSAFIDYALTLYCIYLCLSIVLRRNIKNLRNINTSNLIFDILSWIFCPCCAGLQESRELDDNAYQYPQTNNLQSSSVVLSNVDNPIELQTNKNNNGNNDEITSFKD